ncbi:MAG: hypothetical protein GXY84_07000 [Clostridiales bacterium]|nr:hypothetical protein [Clostridiales bacterium]
MTQGPWQDPGGRQPQQPTAPQAPWAHPGPLPQGEDEEAYFTPAYPQQARQPALPQFNAPPPYQAPVYTNPPPGQPDPDEEPPDDRMVYRAPPRQRNALVFLYLALALLVIVLVSVAASQFFGGQEQQTATVTISEQGSTFSGQTLIVRNESVYQQENVADVRYMAEEGAAVSRGDPVCLVYSTGFSARELERLQSYRAQIKDYHKVLLDASVTPDAQLGRLETMVMQRAQETQALVRGASGNLLNQEQLLKDAISQRHAYLKQKYIEDTKLTRLYDNENSQLQRIETWTKQFAATDNGIVSFYTDGFEAVLNSSNYQEYSPQAVRDMINGKVPQPVSQAKNAIDIFRLVRQFDWGALMLADDLSWNPVVGDQYRMLIESFESTTVSVSVESVTRAGGEMLVRLKADSAIEPILYTRSARVQLSKSVITYAVPASAIINQDGIIGVVVLYREGPYLVPVEVVSQDATQAHVVPVHAGHLYEGLTVRLF